MCIKLDSVSLTINNKPLLNNINCNISPGELTVLIGPNGAGKSTLLKVCAGDLRPVSGSIKLNQRDIHDYSAKTLSSLRAVMTQEYRMSFSFTVREIVNMGCFVYEDVLYQQKQQAIIHEVMQFMNIEALANRHFSTLSGGEQQRTQLARVLAQLWEPYSHNEARYLFLDEPTSSLDIFHQYNVLSLAKQLTKRNIGVLAVVHDLSLAASFANQLILLSGGEIITHGPANEVLQREHLLSVYGIGGHYFHKSEHFQPSLLVENSP
ncbi:MAG: heme ABC transporter ATP-binding protein [Cellvibrionaceae bacterium]